MSVSAGGMGISAGESPETDLALIYQGGENFLARMKALSDATARNDQALRALAIGNNVKAAFDTAAKKNEEAERLRRDAADALDTAKNKAAERIAAAERDAETIIAAAKTDAERIAAVAATNLRQAEATAAEAELLRVQTQTIKNDVSAQLARANAAEAAAAVAVAAAKKVEAEAKATKEQLERKIASVQQALGKATEMS